MKFLSNEELESIAPALAIIGARAKRSITLENLLEGWESTVTQIEDGYALTGYDYANDLATRDLLQEVLASASSAVRAKIMNAIESIDARFRAATRVLSRPLTLADAVNPAWWWLRAPNDLSADLARDLIERQ